MKTDINIRREITFPLLQIASQLIPRRMPQVHLTNAAFRLYRRQEKGRAINQWPAQV